MMNDDGTIGGGVVTFRDITARKQQLERHHIHTRERRHGDLYTAGQQQRCCPVRNDRYNDIVHGRVSSNSVELFARGKNVSTSVTFAHSLERPGVVTEREAPIYFRMDFFL